MQEVIEEQEVPEARAEGNQAEQLRDLSSLDDMTLCWSQ